MIFDVIFRNIHLLLSGLGVTFQIFILAWIGSFLLGIGLGVLRLSSRKAIYWPVTIYIQTMRSIPLILVIFGFYLLLPIITGKSMPSLVSAVISFIVFEAVYFAEIVRGGIQSVRKNLIDAGYSTGLSYFQVMTFIILPQAIKNMIPSIVTQSVVVFQDTALAYVIGVKEFLRITTLVNVREVRSIELYLFAALVYFCICSFGSLLARRMEKRYGG
jgi:glutamate/aspartate transport system permease protein